MSFLFAFALGISALIAGPLLAHLLRRGKAPPQPFPPARLVPAARSLSRSMSRLEDRVLFCLRAALIAVLALLGAVPLVKCSRLSLQRSGGASVAFAIVLDDSLSMRAQTPGGRSRFERAKDNALTLLASARRGDSVAVVLAGRPARTALAPTTDLAVAEQTLRSLSARDLSTDLTGAVELARSLVAELPQKERQLVVLSDFAAEPPPDGAPAVWAPAAELRQAVADCGLISAERQANAVSIQVACNAKEAAESRVIEALGFDPLAGSGTNDAPLASSPLLARAGTQTVSLPLPSGSREVLGVRLTGADALRRDDAVSVARDSRNLEVAVSSDPTHTSVSTGGPTVIEQALAALGEEISVRPLSVLPESPELFMRYSALLLDDPGGVGPEVRAALLSWVQRGGVAVALLGPGASNTALGATLEPFAQGALRWETDSPRGLMPQSLGWLGPEAEGMAELAPRGRVRLESAVTSDARILARWSDQAPFLIEREVGRGVLEVLGLPSSPDQSDFALRPGFLGLLEHFLQLAREHSGQRRALPGDSLRFPAATKVEIIAPDGAPLSHELEGNAEHRQQLFRPELAGRYRVKSSEGVDERVIGFDPAEILGEPRPLSAAQSRAQAAAARSEINASPEFTLAVISLLALELAVRVIRRTRRTSAAEVST